MVVDITDVVDKLQSSFVTWAVNSIYAATVAQPGLGWVAWPVISKIYMGILEWIFKKLSGTAVMKAFFMNTAMRKSGQAGDFVKLQDAKDNLPKDVSDEEYAKAESAAMAAFNDFVIITR